MAAFLVAPLSSCRNDLLEGLMNQLRAMPAIADLSKDDLIWRLDWLGDVVTRW